MQPGSRSCPARPAAPLSASAVVWLCRHGSWLTGVWGPYTPLSATQPGPLRQLPASASPGGGSARCRHSQEPLRPSLPSGSEPCCACAENLDGLARLWCESRTHAVCKRD